MSEVWSVGSYERIAARFAPVQDQLVGAARVRRRASACSTSRPGTGEVAIRAARAGATVTAIDIAEPMLEKARRRADGGGRRRAVRPRRRRVPALRRRVLRRRRSRTSASSSRPTTRTSPRELARVTRPAAGSASRAWKPNPKLGELYRRFTEEPIEGREAYEWGREDHVEDMLGEDFELEFEDGTLWLDADVRRGDLEALLGIGAARAGAARHVSTPSSDEAVPPGVRRALRGAIAPGGRHPRAAPLPARARKEEVWRSRS